MGLPKKSHIWSIQFLISTSFSPSFVLSLCEKHKKQIFSEQYNSRVLSVKKKSPFERNFAHKSQPYVILKQIFIT